MKEWYKLARGFKEKRRKIKSGSNIYRRRLDKNHVQNTRYLNRQSPDYPTEVPATFGASYVLFIIVGGDDSENRFFTRSQRSDL